MRGGGGIIKMDYHERTEIYENRLMPSAQRGRRFEMC